MSNIILQMSHAQIDALPFANQITGEAYVLPADYSPLLDCEGMQAESLRLARIAAGVADCLSLAKVVGGPLLALSNLASPDGSWEQFGAHAVLATGDMVDGKLKRWARAQDPTIKDRPRLDELTDKMYFYTSSVIPLAAREWAQGRRWEAGAIAAVGVVHAVRDVFVTRWRSRAQAEGIPVNAGNLGKRKTFIANVGTGLEYMPTAVEGIVRRAGLVGLVASAALSIASGVQYRRRFTATSGDVC